MAPRVIKRQPLSCENCRKRKIKCTGETPCKTCIHRGFSHTCFYLRHENTSGAAQGSSDEVLQRVKRVESLLERQVQLMERQLHSPPFSDTFPPNEAPSIAYTPATQDSSVVPKVAGSVQTSLGGYQRYIPRAVASDAHHVHELIQSTSIPSIPSNFPFSAETRSCHQSLLEALPPGSHCDELKKVFLEVFSPLFHVLHDPTFEAEYTAFRQSPREGSLSFLALLFVVLSIAVTALDDHHPLLNDLGHQASAAANIKSLATKYRSAAMQCLSADQFLWQHNLHTVQALVMLIYAINHAHGPAWALLGTTFNIAVSIGCHIDPLRLGLEVVDCEQRRRCWAALMMLYTIQNTCLGNIAPVKVLADVRLPADLDDEAIIFGDPNEVTDDGTDRTGPTKMSYILYKFRLYQLASDICQSSYAEQSLNEVSELDSRLSFEEEEHEARFNAADRQLPLYHQAHWYILNNYTNHLRLLLHRPYIQSDTNTVATEDAGLRDQIFRSRETCKNCALKILNNHAYLYENEEFKPYRWFIHGVGSFHAFLAASTLAVILSLNLMTAESDHTSILIVLQKCQDRFQRMAERSSICAKSAAIIGRLLYTSADPSNSQKSPSSGQDALTYSSIDMFSCSSGSVHGESASLNETALFCCPPQMQELIQLPAEQWLGAPSALTWNWSAWEIPHGSQDAGASELMFHNSSMMI